MIADVDDRRIGLRARVGPVGRTVCVSCFRLMRTPRVRVDALVSELDQVRHHKCVITPLRRDRSAGVT
jgi:hypothetical protein